MLKKKRFKKWKKHPLLKRKKDKENQQAKRLHYHVCKYIKIS
jgi:hypothetical protein